MAIHRLIDLDFSPGIRAEYINLNFQLVYDWIRRERLRVGGWGLVEGFDLSYDAFNFTVTVGKGVLINQDGDEVDIDEHTFGVGDMDYDRVSRNYTVDIEGKIILDDCAYNPYKHRYITYNPPNTVQTYDEDILEILDEDGFTVPIVRLINKFLWVDERYAGYTLTVNQIITHDRVDTIMLHKDGTYEYLWSIDSPSPSHVDLADYEETFCIAVVYWQVTDEGITCDFFTNHRSYRKVYVDKNNVLYINGEIYKKQKFIYFEEPAERDREENDLWYNVKDNTLYIWRQVDGEWCWVIVNDHSEILIQEQKIWQPEINPEDLQTFRFEEEEVNLRYVPNTNSLSIVIDNAPLMFDQYEELTVTEQEINSMQDQIDNLELQIKSTQLELELLQLERIKLDGIIRGLRKDLRDSKNMYPAAYDINNKEYEVSRKDVDNLRNLMVIDQRVTQTLEELAELLAKISTVEELLDSYKEQLKVAQSISAGSYVNRGVGFKLKQPLARAAYVAVTVTHQVRMKPARETFQRCSIFIRENDITVAQNGSAQLFRTTSGYSLGEEQLEVFVDGKRLSKGLHEFFENVDQEKEEKTAGLQNYRYDNESMVNAYRGTTSNHFTIMTNLTVGQNVTYRISKQVWSYDQLDTVVGNIKTYAKTAFDRATTALNSVSDMQTNVISTLSDIRNEISVIKATAANVANSYIHGEIISFADTAPQVKESLIGLPIDITRPARSIRIPLQDISVIKDADGVIVGGDVFTVHYVTPEMSRILVREGSGRDIQDIDYWIEPQGSDVAVIILRDDLIADDAMIYVTGFKKGVPAV